MDSSDPSEYYPNLCKHENLDQAFGVYGYLQLSLHGTSSPTAGADTIFIQITMDASLGPPGVSKEAKLSI